jgi:hypothetical protein
LAVVLRGIFAIGSHLITVPHLPNEAVGKRRQEREFSRKWQELPHKIASFAS